MVQREVEIHTHDGVSGASLHIPDGDGPWPAVIMYTDAGGLRDTFRGMGERLAGLGYVTLVPDFYYRHGGFEPFDMRTLYLHPDELERIMHMVGTVTADMAVRDARAYVDFLAALPETASGPVGTTGYCMGGRLSLIVAGHLGDAVGGAASFHGGSIAPADDPDSPHLLADSMAATVYVAAATNDDSSPADQVDRLGRAYRQAGVAHAIETYPAGHGFAVPDTPAYDETAYQRHWSAATSLFAATLPRS
jgi:carboxymethylenebutenolidase